MWRVHPFIYKTSNKQNKARQYHQTEEIYIGKYIFNKGLEWGDAICDYITALMFSSISQSCGHHFKEHKFNQRKSQNNQFMIIYCENVANKHLLTVTDHSENDSFGYIKDCAYLWPSCWVTDQMIIGVCDPKCRYCPRIHRSDRVM